MNPLALSLRVGSSSEVTISSTTVRPTLLLGVVEYWSRIRICSETSTNVPLKKYTPELSMNAEPAPDAFCETAVANPSPAGINVVANVISLLTVRISPSEKEIVESSVELLLK